MADKNQKGEQYDRIASSYLEAKRGCLSNNTDFAQHFVSTHLKDGAGKVLLDVGCGAGDEILAYEKLGFAAVHGIDPSEQMLEQARKKVRHPENLRLATTQNTRYPDQFFDSIVGRFSLHYLEDLDRGYAELARVLRPDGLLAMIAPHPASEAMAPVRSNRDGREYITVTIYNSVEITYPLHTLSEYFSPVFFRLFDLFDVQEYTEDYAADRRLPNAFAFAAKKRR